MRPYERILQSSLRARPDAVIFDWDNTLFNLEKHFPELIGKVLDKYGSPPYPTPEEIAPIWLQNRRGCVEKYFPGHSVKEVMAEWKKAMHEIDPSGFELLPGVEETLQDFRDKGIPLIIVSNKTPERLQQETEAMKIAQYFDIIVGGEEDVRKQKPHFYPIKKAMDEYNAKYRDSGRPPLTLGNLWFVGDHPDDAVAARSDGIQRFIVGDVYRERIHMHYDRNDPFGGIVFLDNVSQLGELARALPASGQDNGFMR